VDERPPLNRGVDPVALTESDKEKAWEPVTVLHFRATREVLEAAQRLCAGTLAKERALGANILGQLGTPERAFPTECFDCLASMLAQDQDADVLNAIAVAFGHLEDPRCVPLLIPLKSHPDENVRFGLVHGLSGHSDENAIETLIELSRDDDDDVRDWATFGIGTLLSSDTPEIRAALRARIDDADADTRAEGIVGLARRKDTGITELLKQELSSDSVDYLMIEAAEELGDSRLYPVLLALRKRWPEDRESELRYLDDAIAACKPS
jgi:HEAT repeat protein